MKPASQSAISRRRFLGGTALASAALASPGLVRSLAADAGGIPPTAPARKIKLGVIGCGSRGKWIANLFASHGGYVVHAVADYFPAVADKAGTELGVDPARRFATLSGYKRLLASGVEAVALETPPYFFPEHAQAAVAAGLHVYCAKPVAVDVPGSFSIEAAARAATAKQRVFFVDYQVPTDPANNEVLKRVRDPESGFGRICRVSTAGSYGHFPDPAKTATLESRLQKLIWVNDIAMGGDYIGNYDIHAIDAALWALGERPVAASGFSRIDRVDPHGDSHDVCLVTFEYPSGVLHDHRGNALKNLSPDELSCRIYGQTGNALLNYWEKATFRSREDAYSGAVEDLYQAGVVRNIASFHLAITQGDLSNSTVPRSIDGALTCVLGRIAGERAQRVTMEQILKENTRLEVDLSGLKT
jgi:myo-inositol 2-dehydrogenase/D-chiro-inositol 1-dehydrogenase